jgi:hypothetical protein
MAIAFVTSGKRSNMTTTSTESNNILLRLIRLPRNMNMLPLESTVTSSSAARRVMAQDAHVLLFYVHGDVMAMVVSLQIPIVGTSSQTDVIYLFKAHRRADDLPILR